MARARIAILAIGALVLGWFVLGLRTGWLLEKRGGAVAPECTEVRVPPGRAAAESAR
jgi:nitric oxide reductase subunit B